MTRTTTLLHDGKAGTDRVSAERGTASAVRAAVHSLFARLGAAPASVDHVTSPAGLAAVDPAERARRAADRDRRERAEAAYRTVEAGGTVALNQALDVFADQIDALERRLERQSEALKAIQLYAPDPWVRRIAQQALIDGSGPLELPSFLIEVEDDRIPLEAYRFIG